nr:mitogen-activated protein kinase hog1 [Quercus suber]
MSITEGSEHIGESGKTYLAVSALGQDNVWTAVEKNNPGNIVVLKSPSADDTSAGWPRFQHEMVMHELFKDSQWIRQQVDRIPASPDSTTPPILVLEILEGTLWAARSKRPFAKGEVKAVARSILHGLCEVHANGLVYADLKMQNIMLSGFDSSTPGDGSSLVTKLGDLGIVMSPSMGKVQPVAYRAPEIHLKYRITEAADIWGFALVYCHLLEAQTRFSRTGLYDDLDTGRGTMPEREEAAKVAVANDYDLFDVEYYRDCPLPCNDPSHEPGRHWQELKKRGLGDEDIAFLKWVLKADPTKRPTASDILASKWFRGGSDSDDAAGAMNGKDALMTGGDSIHATDVQDRTSQAMSQVMNFNMANPNVQEHRNQTPHSGSHEGVTASVAPFLPWLAKSDPAKNAAAQESVDVAATSVSQSSPVRSTQTSQPDSLGGSTLASDTGPAAAAPFLPWLQTSTSKVNASIPNANIPADTFSPSPNNTETSLKSHPLVLTALKNQDGHNDNGSTISPTAKSVECDREVSSDNDVTTTRPSSNLKEVPTGGTYLSYR